MAQCQICQKQYVPSAFAKNGTCSGACLMKLNLRPTSVVVTCKVCGKVGSYLRTESQAIYKVCSKACLTNYNRRAEAASILFGGAAPVTQYMNDQDLARLAQVNRSLNRTAMVTQLSPVYRQQATHYDGAREVQIAPDNMMQIALDAYRAALSLKSQNVPVILYRVRDKRKLSHAQERLQTVAGAARTFDNLWPVERTAAWIQGAMRARIPFLLLTDPRDPEVLKGGKDKVSDAVYVRELHQILQTSYTIGTTEHLTREGRVTVFMLIPPAVDTGPQPLVPRMSARMDFDHTWQASEPKLKVSGSEERISASLVEQFTTAGAHLRVAAY